MNKLFTTSVSVGLAVSGCQTNPNSQASITESSDGFIVAMQSYEDDLRAKKCDGSEHYSKFEISATIEEEKFVSNLALSLEDFSKAKAISVYDSHTLDMKNSYIRLGQLRLRAAEIRAKMIRPWRVAIANAALQGGCMQVAAKNCKRILDVLTGSEFAVEKAFATNCLARANQRS